MPVLSLKRISQIRKKLKNVVLAGGAFDILHAGHIKHLKQAKSLGEHLFIHITTDKRLKEKKGPSRPIIDQKQRALLVSSLNMVDNVFISPGKHYNLDIIKAIKPDCLFFHKESAPDSECLENLRRSFPKIKIFISKRKRIHSTTSIIEKIKSLS